MANGTFYLMLASGVFAFTGYIIHFGLGRYLGPAEYGVFGIIVSLMTVINTFCVTGFPQSAARYIAVDSARLGSIIRDANRVQLALTAVIFALYFGLAGVLANLLNDSSLTPYIRISALVVPTYTLYGIYSSGYLNGLRRFGKQSISIFGNSIAKIVLVFILVVLGFGVKGAIIGYSLAALVGFLLAWRFLGPVEKSHTSYGKKKLASFGVLATLFAAMLFFLMSIDLLAVKALGVGEVEVGYYTSASTMSKVPYTILTGLAVTLLPTISKSTSINAIEMTRSYIRQSMRYMLMLLVPVVVLISATSGDLLALVYSSRYLDAAAPLSILVFGLAQLSIFFVLANIIMGSGKPGVVLIIALPLVAIDISFNILLIPTYGIVGAAWATTITGFLGMSALVIYVLGQFKALVNLKSLGRICLASAVIYVIASLLHFSPLWLPLIYIVLFVFYTGILWITRELQSNDLAIFKSLMPVKKSIKDTKVII